MRTLIAVSVLSCLLAALGGSPFAQAQEDDAPRVLDQISFGGARPGSVQQTSGVRARGDLVSITPEQVVLRRQAKTFEIPMDKVKSITTTDGNFSYSPADETFDSLLRRCRRIPGVTIGKTEVYDPIEPESPSTASNPRRTPPVASTTEPPAVETPAATPGETATTPEEPEPETPRLATTTNTAGDPAPGSTIAYCASCKEQIPLSLRNGDRCPHCQVIIWNGPSVIESGSNSYPSGAGGSTGGGNATGGAAYPTGAGAAAPAAPATTPIEGGVPAASMGGFANTPLWMKVALFGGLLAVIWLLLQRR